MSRGCSGSERPFVPPGNRCAIRHPVAPDAGFTAALGAGNRRRGVGAHLVRDSRKARVLEIPETESRAGGAGDATPRTMRRRGTRKRDSTSDPECTTTSVRLSARAACCGAAPRRVGPPESPASPRLNSREIFSMLRWIQVFSRPNTRPGFSNRCLKVHTKFTGLDFLFTVAIDPAAAFALFSIAHGPAQQ